MRQAHGRAVGARSSRPQARPRPDIRQLQIPRRPRPGEAFHAAPPEGLLGTQPTLSGRIRQLEQELGVPIVERGHRFLGLTPDGERVLKWARTILDNWSSLQQEIASLRRQTARWRAGCRSASIPYGAARGDARDQGDPGPLPAGSRSPCCRSVRSTSCATSRTSRSTWASPTSTTNPSRACAPKPVYMERYCLLVRADNTIAPAGHRSRGRRRPSSRCAC